MGTAGVVTPLPNFSVRYSMSSVPFGPGLPMRPTLGIGVRAFDYQPAINTMYRPRHGEEFNFAQLRAFARVELCGLCIETRLDQVEALDWQVRAKGVKNPTTDQLARIKAVEARLQYPDLQNDFSTWTRMLFGDLLEIDAPTLERRRTRNGKVASHDVVDGSTIHLIIDATGRRPKDPKAEAYQQIIRGTVASNLTNEDIIYAPRNLRAGHIYGKSPVEQAIQSIKTAIERQKAQLAYFTDGNVPAGFVTTPTTWTEAQVKMMQDYMDAALSGQLGEKAKAMVAPGGVGYVPIKQPPLKDDFDEWLARVICAAFKLPPTPFIKQMNRSTAETDADRGEKEGLEPLKRWFCRLMTRIIAEDYECPDLEFVFVDESDIDAEAQSRIDDTGIRNASVTIDEARERRGQDPLPDGLGSEPIIITAAGAIRLSDALKASLHACEATEEGKDQPDGTEKPGADDTNPDGDPSSKENQDDD